MIDLKYLQDTINVGWIPTVKLDKGLSIGDTCKKEATPYTPESGWLVMGIVNRDRGLYAALPLRKKEDVE